jgi:hypothetical protein
LLAREVFQIMQAWRPATLLRIIFKRGEKVVQSSIAVVAIAIGISVTDLSAQSPEPRGQRPQRIAGEGAAPGVARRSAG